MAGKKELVGAAKRAMQNARAAYSGFRVGAAVETRSGKVFTGCNIENATYGLTVCAERVAVWKALSEGESDFRRIAIATASEELTPPCGACRQILWEYCGDIEIFLANTRGGAARFRLARLLPLPFDTRFLEKKARARKS